MKRIDVKKLREEIQVVNRHRKGIELLPNPFVSSLKADASEQEIKARRAEVMLYWERCSLEYAVALYALRSYLSGRQHILYRMEPNYQADGCLVRREYVGLESQVPLFQKYLARFELPEAQPEA